MRARSGVLRAHPRTGSRAIVAGFIAIGASVGTRFSYAVVLAGLAHKIGEAIGLVALGLAVHWLVFMLAAPLAWRAYVRVGARRMITGGGILCGLSLALLPTVPSLPIAFLIFGVLSGLGSHGLGQLVTNQPVIAAVPAGAARDRGFALIACGAPVGTAVLPAFGTLVIDRADWGWGCVAVGALVCAMCMLAAGITTQGTPGPNRPTKATKTLAGTRPPWLHPSFFLLGLGFGFALLVQTGVPFVLPIWGDLQGLTADQIAGAFVVIGVAGVLGRVLMASRYLLFDMRLWIVIPAALLGVLGFMIAAFFPPTVAWFYVAVALLGFTTQLIGALFAIANLACFPEANFAQIAGTLLAPIGLAAAVASFLPGLLVNSALPLSAIWTILGGVSLAGALAIQGAELTSPVYREHRRGAALSDTTKNLPTISSPDLA